MRGRLCLTQSVCQELRESKDSAFSRPPLYIFLSQSPVSHQGLGQWGPHSAPQLGPPTTGPYWRGDVNILLLTGGTC